ncbi:ATP-binding protein [Massilia litorea]|uniref:ATP-binding protein n=1 Tax=Massilia litorea TaxID=2769491 RepID=UPI001D0D4E0B|nr:ATP-binding protein [Massilia litorea]
MDTLALDSESRPDINAPCPAPAVLPPAPLTVAQTGLPFLFLAELAVKTLFLGGLLRITELSARMKLGIGVIEPLIVYLRAERLCEISRAGATGTDADVCYKLTDLGRARGAEFLARCGYTGPAPVTLESYGDAVVARSVAAMHIGRAAVQAGFGQVVVPPAILDQLGTAMNSGRAMFIHGPAGSGKTFLAERLAELLTGAIAVPYAIYAGGEVIQMYDPVVHLPAETGPVPGLPFRRAAGDARWVHCRRPAVLTGGELSLDMLDLKFDHATRYYQAPPHLKANNGIFIIDDLGRQRCAPADLLNRWIVPMDRRVDFLSLHTGYKFEVPFDVIVVFSSNLPPAELGDGAFLRRIGYKIHVGPLGEDHYRRIFIEACAGLGIAWDEEAFDWLLKERHAREDRPLLACYPRDLLSQVRDRAAYEGVPPELTPDSLDWAWNNFFTGVQQAPATGTEGE